MNDACDFGLGCGPEARRYPARAGGPRQAPAGRGLGLGLLLEALGPAVRSGNFNDDATPRLPLHGAYALRPEGPGVALPRRLFVHRRGYLILENTDGRFQDYALRYAAGQRLLLSGPAGLMGDWHYRADSAGLHLRGTLAGDSVRWRALPWRQLPLLQRDWRRTADGE